MTVSDVGDDAQRKKDMFVQNSTFLTPSKSDCAFSDLFQYFTRN